MGLAVLVTGSAAFYAATMVLMKHWGALSPGVMAALIGGAFALGAWCEVEALKSARLSAIYVAILGIECIFISAISFAFLRESLSWQELAGAVLIMLGVAVASA